MALGGPFSDPKLGKDRMARKRFFQSTEKLAAFYYEPDLVYGMYVDR